MLKCWKYFRVDIIERVDIIDRVDVFDRVDTVDSIDCLQSYLIKKPGVLVSEAVKVRFLGNSAHFTTRTSETQVSG